MKYIFIFYIFISTLSFGQITYKPNDTTSYFALHYQYPTPDSVKSIISHAVYDISRAIYSKEKISINVLWVSQDSNIEASCVPTSFVQNFKNCPKTNILYPIALAEKIAELDINNPSDPDILMTINKNMTWYLGLDSKPTNQQVDLYTILLHELCHGLGLVTNFNVLNSLGYINGIGLPFIFDTFLVDSKGRHLLDSTIYQNNSSMLYRAFTSDSIFFSGSFVHIMNNNKNAQLYAPSTYDPGSSLEHLNDKSYPRGNPNSLFNHGKNKGESIHSLGPILTGLLADIGWNNSFLSVPILTDKEDLLSSSEVLAFSNSMILSNSLTLHYSYDNFQNAISTVFTKTDTLNYFKAIIPSLPFGHTVSYYVTATDTSSFKVNVGIPTNYPTNNYAFYVGKDTIKPKITFTPFSTLYSDVDTLFVSAQVTDNIGIDSVWISYMINSTSILHSYNVKLNKTIGNLYSGNILLKNKISINDQFFYKIFAVDSSSNKNRAETVGNDINSLYYVQISPNKTPFVTYEDNFQDTLFSQQKMSLHGFTISKSIDLDTISLQTNHPYPTALYTKHTIDLTATFINPCVIRDQEAYMDFDEIVLVEPANSGAVYGDFGFFDYCIVEGSKDNVNWYAFDQKGYKTELFSDWMQTYYSNTFVDNFGKLSSIAKPTKSLYHHHTVNLLGNKYLRKGDNVFIRFRLFSDAFTNGWGWAINNLKIQTTAVSNSILENKFKVYPTISRTNTFTLYHSNDVTIKNLEVYSVLGLKSEFSVNKNSEEESLLSIRANSGIYFIRIILDNGSIETCKVVLLANSNE